MNIAVNTRFLLRNKLEGIGIYTHELFSRVVRLMPEHQFFFYFDRAYHQSFIYSDNIIPKVVFPPARHPLLWYAWFELSIPFRLKEDKIDLFISPDGYCSLQTDVPQIMTVHDLAFEHYPQFIPPGVAQYYKRNVPKYCKKAIKLWTVSEFTKSDIVNRYGIEKNKIEVIYNSVDFSTNTLSHKFSPLAIPPYFMFIGAVHPRKNVLRLLKAFTTFKQKKSSNIKLLIIGSNAWMNDDVKAYYEATASKVDVIWIESCRRDELLYYLRNAYAFIYPSLFEGFGIPIIEAMQCGVPVACSNTSCLPEIADDAALYFNPELVEDIKNAMTLISEDETLRRLLSEKGKQRAATFSWDESAQKMADSIRSSLLH